MLFKFLVFVLVLISSSNANLVRRFSDELQTVQRDNTNNGNIWVVLVAGSNGYYNYRHQADVLHAYQLVHKKHQIPKERIILFMYDDIANNRLNPHKNNVINYPGGENLYTKDIEKDYIKNDVTPSNFLGALTKDPKLVKQNKKVLNSTSEDFVFIYFTDHGAPGLVAFPDGVLTAKQLNGAINKMQETKSFNKMVIYIEACESGSMFDDKLNPKGNSSIYALTASLYNEPSFAIFWDKDRQTYLADEFSINWILDSYSLDETNKDETLKNQYLNVRSKTNGSHVTEFGDLNMAKKETVSEFQGKLEGGNSSTNQIIKKLSDYTMEEKRPIRSDEVEFYMTKIYSDLNKDQTFEQVQEGRKTIDRFIERLRIKFASKLNVNVHELRGKNKIQNHDCYDELVQHLHTACLPLHDHTYLFRHLYLFVNTCNLIQKQNLNVNLSSLNQIVSQQCFSVNYLNQITKVV